jgi:hypothetical protein
LISSEIISKFHLYVGDQSELSSTDELDLLNNVYQGVMQDRPWEFLKKSISGSILNDGTVSYIPIPADFRQFTEDNSKTDNTYEVNNNASPKVIYTGSTYTPVQIVNWSDRRQVRNTSGFAYLDSANSRIAFTWLCPDSTYEFDYIFQWPELTLTTSPLFPADFHNMLFQLMAVDSVIINLFDRAHSYAAENQAGATRLMKALCYYNASLQLN